jgi:hypothetical protein
MTHVLKELNHKGDTRIQWDPDDPNSVEQARRTFNELKKKGYAAFRVNRKGDKGETMKEFDPEALSITMSPPQAGG